MITDIRFLGASASAVIRLLCALPAVAACAGPAMAQQLTPQQVERMLGQGETSAPADENTAWANPGIRGPLLDQPISRTEYRLGPGDQLTLSIFGYRNEVFQLSVTPEGTLVMPTIGVVPVRGLNLNEAARRARQRVLRFYPDSEVDLTLAAVRSFKIFLIGDVANAGILPATAVTRVSEVVSPRSESDVIYRNVVLRRGQDTLRVDLTRFLRTGDLEQNPFLLEGDVIQVPSVDETVTVAGEVSYPGTYEYRPGETLAELIGISNGGGPFLSRAADTLLLMRFTDDPRGQIIPIPRDEALGIRGSSMVLEPFDAIFVPRLSHYKERTSATIQGEVEQPGTYPVVPNVTTVRDLVEMAGGFTSMASPAETVLRRDARGLPASVNQPLSAVPPEFLTPDERRVLQVTSRSDEQTVLVDISSESQAFDIPLEAGDALFVPKRRDEVVVLGAVGRPGLVVHAPGQSVDHFVEMAGGYMRRADIGDVVVVRTGSGTQVHRKDIESVEPGDRIIVPYRVRTTFLERVQTTQGVINTLSGLVLTIVGLERLWDAISN